MTPKEKAEELIRKYYTFGINKEGQTLSWHECKQCALISVDEIIEAIDWHLYENPDYDYWEEVKTELEKL